MFHRSSVKMSKIISNSLESLFAEHEFSNTLQLWAFFGQAEGLSQTLKEPAQKLFALLSYHPLCSDMVTKKNPNLLSQLWKQDMSEKEGE